MYQNKYFTSTEGASGNKPLTASEGVEARKYAGNPLLKEVDEELKRLRSQFDRVSSSSYGSTTPSSTPTSYNNTSSCKDTTTQTIPPTPARTQELMTSRDPTTALQTLSRQPPHTPRRAIPERERGRTTIGTVQDTAGKQHQMCPRE